jgi:hypothetical protein
MFAVLKAFEYLRLGWRMYWLPTATAAAQACAWQHHKQLRRPVNMFSPLLTGFDEDLTRIRRCNVKDLLTKCVRVPAHLNHLLGCCACCALHIVANGSVNGSLCRSKRCEQPVTCACSCVAHCSRCRHAAHLAGADHSSWNDTVKYTSGQMAERAACMLQDVQRSQRSRKSKCDAA